MHILPCVTLLCLSELHTMKSVSVMAWDEEPPTDEEPGTKTATILPPVATPERVIIPYSLTVSLGDVKEYDPYAVCTLLFRVMKESVPNLEGILLTKSCLIDKHSELTDVHLCNSVLLECKSWHSTSTTSSRIATTGPCTNPPQCITFIHYTAFVYREDSADDVRKAAETLKKPNSEFRLQYPLPSEPPVTPPVAVLIDNNDTNSSPIILWLGIAGIGGALVLGSLLIVRLTGMGRVGGTVQLINETGAEDTVKPTLMKRKLSDCESSVAKYEAWMQKAPTSPLLSPVSGLQIATGLPLTDKYISTRYASVADSLETLNNMHVAANPLYPPDSQANSHTALEKYSLTLLVEALRDAGLDVSGMPPGMLVQRALRLIDIRSRPLAFCAHCTQERTKTTILCCCRKVCYCSEDCQVRHWCYHSSECEP
eukprot:TRINITY_DN37460_c0_g1_i1.p1 TRINITY_DN37460_c0_g1~~TRINITY_DN37460_c0_g1_i1.p1  ORF type:complete len:426 (+),score=22.17 TRINITY_DN37460_c0_g1_i1:62-1339(+)